MDTPTVYMCLSKPDEDGDCVERIALHPGLDTQPMGEGAKFPFRVIWRWVLRNGTCLRQENIPLHASCRGKAYEGDSDYPSPTFDGMDDALQWLLDGEEPAKKAAPDTLKGVSDEVRATADLFEGAGFDEGDAAATQDLFDDLGY